MIFIEHEFIPDLTIADAAVCRVRTEACKHVMTEGDYQWFYCWYCNVNYSWYLQGYEQMESREEAVQKLYEHIHHLRGGFRGTGCPVYEYWYFQEIYGNSVTELVEWCPDPEKWIFQGPEDLHPAEGQQITVVDIGPDRWGRCKKINPLPDGWHYVTYDNGRKRVGFYDKADYFQHMCWAIVEHD
jgi:hypothetical protein